MTTRETKLIIICVALAALFVYALVAGQMAVRQQIRRINQIEQRQKETSETIHQIKQDKVTTDTIKKTIEELPQSYRIRAHHYGAVVSDLPSRGGNGWIDRIDAYVARTPLAGQGRTFYLAAVDAGIKPDLMPAIAMVESGAGRANANKNNFFGRKAPGGGWEAWDTPEAAIYNQAGYISGYSSEAAMFEVYCKPSGPWKVKIARERAKV